MMMKLSFVLASIASLSFVSATPVPRAAVSSTANGMLDVINGKASCANTAVIFARGTFDEGNIGVWVGPNLQQGLAKIGSVAFQGVDPTAYKADLQGYLGDGGSNAGAASLASTVTSYVKACPQSTIVISGWSQGALVAHKGLNKLDSATQKKVAALVTFGDPWNLFDATPVPAGVQYKGFCVTGTTLDPLCANIPGDFKIPTSADDIIGQFKQLPSFAQGAQQAASALQLVKAFPGQLVDAFRAFASTLLHGKAIRLLLTPQHFMYGNNGMAGQAADFIAGLPAVKGAASLKAASFKKAAPKAAAKAAPAAKKH